jgi:Na+-translocating ferredoxin:NAD+ oxidoreductase RnfG subunit
MSLKHSTASSGRSFAALFAVTVAFILLLAALDWWTYPLILRNEFRTFATMVANRPRTAAETSVTINSGQTLPASQAQVELLKPLFPDADAYTVIGIAVFANHPAEILKAASGDKAIGYAIHGYADGYHGVVHTLVTTDSNFNVKSVQIVSHTETDGYADRFASREFLHQFIGKPVGRLRLGKGIDSVSGATVSCKAVADGVAAAVDYLYKYISEGKTIAPVSSAMIAAAEQVHATTAASGDDFGGHDGTLSIFHKDKGVGCRLCHLEAKPPYTTNVPTKICLDCHENGFSLQEDGTKMLADVQQKLEAVPGGGKAMLAEPTEKLTPANDKNDQAVYLRLQYLATKNIEDARPKWAVRAIYQGEPSDPHVSHIPIHDCTVCHHIHKASEDRCGTRACHPDFTYKMR